MPSEKSIPNTVSSSANHTLLTDLYQLTMAQGYWQTGQADTQACFHAFFRDNPYGGGFAVACGIAQVSELVANFHFSADDIEYLAALPAPDGSTLFSPAFLEWLAEMRLSVNIEAVREGTVVFPREPLVRVTGPIVQCQLLETALLNCVNFQTLVATKAARVCLAAAGGSVAEFGLRRAQGPDGGLSASRAAYIGGCASTSNTLAGKIYGIPVSGTHAHSWVMAFPSEIESFRAYAQVMPGNCVLLVDTYDVIKGVENAIVVGREMAACGESLAGIRIDSGDLAWFSKRAREMLDAAGLTDVIIVASNDLDEYTISSLLDEGAPIDSWGVGTRLATAYDQPALAGVYKLSAVKPADSAVWFPRIKVSEQASKLTIPGVLEVRRYYHEDGTLSGDMILDELRRPTDEEIIVDPTDPTRRKDLTGRRFEMLLAPLVTDGEIVRLSESVHVSRERAASQIANLDPSVKRFLHPHSYPVGMERGLHDLRTALIFELRGLDPATAVPLPEAIDEVRETLSQHPVENDRRL